MKTYLQNSLIKLLKAGERVKNSSILSDTSWLLMNPDELTKIVYIFKSKGNELYHSFNGNITKGNWEFIVDSDSLVIELEGQTELYNARLLANDFLVINKDGDSKSLVFANFTKYKDWLKNEIFDKLQSLNEEDPSSELNENVNSIKSNVVETSFENIETFNSIMSNSPFKLLEKSNLIVPLSELKPNIKGLNKIVFFMAVEYTNNGMFNNNLNEGGIEKEIQFKEIARYLSVEQAYKPIKEAYFAAKKYPNYIGVFKSELANYLELEDE